MLGYNLVAVWAALSAGLVAASTFSPTKPPAVPLAVRSPYLNAWLNGDTGCILPGNWPKFWTAQIQGWQGLVMVDGTAYNWMGALAGGEPVVTQTSLEYTSTQSIFTFDVNGEVTLTVTFLSPIYANDLARQSQQFSYITFEAAAADGNQHDVQVYMDVTGEWAGGDITQTVEWQHGTSGDVTYHQFYLANQTVFTESGEIAAWGNWFLSTATTDNLTYQIGGSASVRDEFLSNGALPNTVDTDFRAINNDWPVFAFAHDQGSISSQGSQVVWSLGLVQDEVIDFAGLSGVLGPVSGLWSSYYSSDVAAMVAFHDDYSYALSASNSLDSQIQADAVNVGGQNYSTIVSLAARQVFGALTVAGNSTKEYIFLKEISSDSDIQTVDVIFPMFPFIVYMNAALAKPLLDPLFDNQESGAYPNTYAEHDLGIFPVAKGYPAGNDEKMPVEECGNMIIMTLAYAQRTGDDAYLTAHFPKLTQWAGYLVNDSLTPSNQISTDDFAGSLANQTNLALKGIIGLRAMGEIAVRTNNSDIYSGLATQYLEQWKIYGINNASSPPHTTLSYGDSTSHGLLYNIYADRLLGLNFVDQWIFDMQSAFYPTVVDTYGAALDTRHTWAKADWQMFAGAVASNSTKQLFIDRLAAWIPSTTTDRPMTDLFDAVTGGWPSGGPTFVARPAIGGVFALLALP